MPDPWDGDSEGIATSCCPNGRQREGESSSRIEDLLGRALGSNSCEEEKEAEVAEWVEEEVRLLMWLQCRSQLTMQGRLRTGWGCRTFLSAPKQSAMPLSLHIPRSLEVSCPEDATLHAKWIFCSWRKPLQGAKEQGCLPEALLEVSGMRDTLEELIKVAMIELLRSKLQ